MFILKRKTVIQLILFFIALKAGAFSFKDTLSKIENELKVKIVYDKTVKDTWNKTSYDLCSESDTTFEYLQMLRKEYAKYPVNFLKLSGIETIVLGNNLKFANEFRAAVPDPYKGTLYLSVNGQNGGARKTYLVHVMHHELFHCTEYAMWSDLSYKWRKWKRTNVFLFRYLGGGAIAYKKSQTDWYSITHPKAGFLNLYSTTAQEEDRCELMAFIMCDDERKEMLKYYTEDKIIRKKVELLFAKLDEFCKEKNPFWKFTELVPQTPAVEN